MQSVITLLFCKGSKETKFIISNLNMGCCNTCGNFGLLRCFAISHNITFHYELSSG